MYKYILNKHISLVLFSLWKNKKTFLTETPTILSEPSAQVPTSNCFHTVFVNNT